MFVFYLVIFLNFLGYDRFLFDSFEFSRLTVLLTNIYMGFFPLSYRVDWDSIAVVRNSDESQHARLGTDFSEKLLVFSFSFDT